MKNYYTKIYLIFILTLSTQISMGQNVNKKQLPNFTNPLQSKKMKSVGDSTKPNALINLSKKGIKTVNGSFFLNLSNQKIKYDNLKDKLNDLFSLNDDHSFNEIQYNNQRSKKLYSKDNKKDINKIQLQHLCKGIKVEQSSIIVYVENGLVRTINGRILEFESLEIDKNLTKEQALQIAKDYLNVTELIRSYPIETVIAKIPDEKNQLKLVHKVRIDSQEPFEMCHILIDTTTKEVINKININAHADVPGTAQTLYSGNQSITCDSHQGNYRLRENGRNIQTFNASNANALNQNGITGSTDFISSTTDWSNSPALNSFTISNVEQSWWYTLFADQTPDLYIKVKNGNGDTVYTSGYYDDVFPTVSWQDLNIILTDASHTVEVWDFDPVGSDDFGGSYSISTNLGNQNWSGNGNNGSYDIVSSGIAAHDLHWGMEKTYDFYLNVLGRDSYDNNGSLIKQYFNPPSSLVGTMPNNAAALGPPYNYLVFGPGDDQIFGPLVSVDVVGHEFTHMVINFNGNGGLTYQGESGALNESFADIFGTCVEFYSNVNTDWNIGEDFSVSNAFMRSMATPNARLDPDTYDGNYWIDPNSNQDNGGVHTNSGVQNHWFYLLSVGGSGTNDNGDSYSVNGIGIDSARDIAYHNLTNYLTQNASYMDAYLGSLQSAEDLFGSSSTEYSSVEQAWFAVGVGSNPNNSCSGSTNLTETSGSFTDGSGSSDYQNDTDCTWVIAPPGANQITLNFTAFDTEAGYDEVYVYDGPDDTYPLLASLSGNSLPSSISTSSGVGAMTVKFQSDFSITKSGWSANYNSTGVTPSCSGGTVLSSSSGTFSDGSGNNDYSNNQVCYWLISPPCANSVTLSLSQFNTEQGSDGLIIYDDLDATNQIAVLTGSNQPGTVTSNTGEMLVIFVSNFSINKQGFSANYTSTGSSYCTGTTSLNSSDWGSISDGSGNSNYCNNSSCEWLIQPPQATSITLEFTDFDLETPPSDGQNVNDAVEVYDGTDDNGILLGVFSGNNLPPTITSNSGNMFIKFYSDIETNAQGWEAIYTSTQNPSCSGNSILNSPNGNFSDGSGNINYANNSDCSWLIQPQNAIEITLSFSSFDTEQNYDGVLVYDGVDETAPLLGQFSGSNIPNSISSSDGSMYIKFLTDGSVRKNGWTANYTSTTLGIEQIDFSDNIKVFPNPSNGVFTIESKIDKKINVKLVDLLGKYINKSFEISNGLNRINVESLSSGTYILMFEINEQKASKRLIIK